MTKQMDKKERIQGIVFARAFCAIGIIVFHYFCHSRGRFRFMITTANAGWGEMLVTAFFAISGAVLYYNHPTVTSLRSFYFKRWKSIFPPFYLCFLFFFLRNVFRVHKVFYGPPWPRIFLTVFGIDGYFGYAIPNYYLVGEWFLGAIVMLYAIYPLLAFVMNKNRFAVPILLVCGYAWMLGTDFFNIMERRNFITCITSFYCGMVFIQHKEFFFREKTTGMTALVLFLLLCFVKLPKCQPISQIQGLALMIFLVQAGNFAMGTKAKTWIAEISGLSFCIFLFQHRVIYDLQGVYNPDKWPQILPMLGTTILLTLVCAKMLSIIVASMTGSKIFKFVESKFTATPTRP